MRVTIHLDDDVAVELEFRCRESGLPFEQIVNDAIRAGLAAERVERAPKKIRRTRPVKVGQILVPDVDCTSELLAIAEGENYR